MSHSHGIPVRIWIAVALCALVSIACGSGGGSQDPGPDPGAQEANDDGFPETPPLEVPKDCPKPSTDLELANHGASWVGENGKPVKNFKKCLTAPANEPFSITYNNVRVKGVRPYQHNVSVYSDAAALEEVVRGKVIGPGKTVTTKVEPLSAGTYLFKCDLHPHTMKGILVVE